MTGFLLSPGITPQMTDLFVLEFPIALGFGYFLQGRRGVELVVALNAVVLALIKLTTDLPDPWDVLVAVGVLAGGLGVAYPLLAEGAPRLSFGLSVGLGAVVGALGCLKALSDFYDPFDLLMADLGIVTGLWLGRPLFERWFPALARSGRHRPPEPARPS
ncbi:MAG: hypothetical protein L3K19_02895 [Thermoplasmata archaeon]|nr:hypothetical protein [Thermoplasmata archaeon]